MARKNQTSTEVNEYVNKVTGETVGAYVGTEQDKVYANDADYEPLGKPRPAHEEQAASGGSKEEPNGTGTSDMEGLSRDELNALATEHGVENPEGLANKDEVKKAILEAASGGSKE